MCFELSILAHWLFNDLQNTNINEIGRLAFKIQLFTHENTIHRHRYCLPKCSAFFFIERNYFKNMFVIVSPRLVMQNKNNFLKVNLSHGTNPKT